MSDIQNDNAKIQDEPNLTANEITLPKDDGDGDPDPYCCAPKDPGGPDGTP